MHQLINSVTLVKGSSFYHKRPQFSMRDRTTLIQDVYVVTTNWIAADSKLAAMCMARALFTKAAKRGFDQS